MTRFLSGPTRSVVNNILFTLDLSCRRHGDLYYFSAVRASEPDYDFISLIAADVQHPSVTDRAYPCFRHMVSFPRSPVCRGTEFPIFSIHVINYCPVFISYTVLCLKKGSRIFSIPGCPMYALFFFWFPYCRDKVVAFGAFRCDLHLSGGIRPYVQQTPSTSWAF